MLALFVTSQRDSSLELYPLRRIGWMDALLTMTAKASDSVSDSDLHMIAIKYT